MILCAKCHATSGQHLTPTGSYSVDGCDMCDDKRAGHQLYEPQADD